MAIREGNLEAPTRHPLDWKNPGIFTSSDLKMKPGQVQGVRLPLA